MCCGPKGIAPIKVPALAKPKSHPTVMQITDGLQNEALDDAETFHMRIETPQN